HLARDLIKAKVAASIAHFYDRPRVWLEGFYGSGWGTSSAEFVDAVLANYALGFNLLGIHGMYYTTHGGWWEWAPPDNTFRMPYWRHMKPFMMAQQRLAYLLSQGHHRCDVAIMYPVAPVEAGMNGKAAVDAAFQSARDIHSQGIDFVFMDYQSLDRADIVGKELHVSGAAYKALVLPAMRAIRHSNLQKALEFKRAGGLVLAVGNLPQASDRLGRDDPEAAAMVAELFPQGAVKDLVAAIPFRDYRGPGRVLHRRIGPRDVYALYGATKGTEAFFRATGAVELWDPWTGHTRPLPVVSQDSVGTTLKLPLTEREMQLIVFSPGEPAMETPLTATKPTVVRLDGEWEFELAPILDNRFGDFHWPPRKALIGAEARRMKYADEVSPSPGWQDAKLDDSKWATTACGFGPRFWKLGPLPDSAAADEALAQLTQINPAEAVLVGGNDYLWQPYEFSWRCGIPGDCGVQGYHGLKIVVHDDLIGLGGIAHGHPECKRVPEQGGTRYYLWSSVHSPDGGSTPVSSGGMLPAKAWLGGQPLDPKASEVNLARGPNALLLRYDSPGRGWLVFGSARQPVPYDKNKPIPWNTELASIWHNDTGRLAFDTRPHVTSPAGWYRFTAPPGLRSLHLPCMAKPRVWVDGIEAGVSGRKGDWTAKPAEPAAGAAVVAIRLEQERGEYAGAAFSEFLKLDCGQGNTSLGDWSKMGVLETYSGGAWYRRSFNLPATAAGKLVTLDLGHVVASAEVRVNGKPAGIKVAPPWTLDITEYVQPGQNRVEVLVCNTLANHYVTVPTHFRGKLDSGLLGPVSLQLQP
nr:hypothetical protein [Akkermansiaceae bacterium]